MKKLVTGIVDSLGLAYWTEITTDNPSCIYYFGPFVSKREALSAQNGYIEDLKGEQAQGIEVVTKRCQPKQLTIFDEGDDDNGLKFKPVPIFGTQYS